MCQGGGPAKAGRITGGEVFELLNRAMQARLLVGEEREGLLVLESEPFI